MSSFVHLHNHSEYSLLDGASRVEDMVKRAKELDMPALAITDHGVMFGCMEFYFAAKKAGIKPILGMEAYITADHKDKKVRRDERELRHLLLLARNKEGYNNLCKLHTIAALEGFHYKPRLDHEVLRQFSKGLISSTTCIGSEVNQLLLKGEYQEAQYRAGMYKDMFDEGCYFVELQDHGLPEQIAMNEGLLRIAKELKLPLVVTNDSHYLCKTDAEPHDVLLCIQTQAQQADENRFKFKGDEFYIKSTDEMAGLFPQHPEAMENSLYFADKVELYELGSQRAIMPDPAMPEGFEPETYLRHLAEKGLKDRVKGATDEAWQRLNFELEVIGKTNYEAYFLLVREFADFTRDQGIMFGVRGSAAGSLVSYTLGITDVNPLEYDLTFERFLNPERVSMPDIDMDFEDARRDEVIKWVGQRYGQDRVAQIITFGTLGAKAAIRDVARVTGMSAQDADRLAKAVPIGPGWTLDKALKEVPEFRQLVLGDSRYAQVVETAKKIEGICRNQAVHAAGVVITKEPLENYIPVYRAGENQPVTAYEMGILEKIGLLKMDFLGLSNLTVLARTIENIKASLGHGGNKLLSDHPVLQGHVHIPLDDQPTFDMLTRGETVGVFQLESGGMRRNIVELKPQSVKELAAMVALYRPGPMDHIPTFVNQKFGREPIKYLDERMRPILEETFGVIVYQDQVLKLVQALAGFSLGKADILRRAMGKKDAEQMAAMNVEFMDGCEANGVAKKSAEEIWELLLPFAGYAFNKAHAVCYAILAYQTAYLKAHYPVEYMAGLLAVYRSKEDRVTAFIEECRRQKIVVLPPDINKSSADFTIERTKTQAGIRFGLGAIKGVGDNLIEAIVEERKCGPFTHIYEFCERLRPFGLNKGSLEALIRAGAMDSVHKNRAMMTEVIAGAMVYADNEVKRKEAGQDSLFGEANGVAAMPLPILPTHIPLPGRSEILAMEKETMGIYISDHPLRGYERAVMAVRTHTCAQVAEMEEVTKVTVAGVLAQCSKTIAKSGNRVCRFVVEDFTGQVAGFAFGDTITKFEAALGKDKVVKLTGRLKFDERGNNTERKGEVQLFEVSVIDPPAEVTSLDDTSAGTVFCSVASATRPELEAFRSAIEAHPGHFDVILQVRSERNIPPIVLLSRVNPADSVLAEIRKTIGGMMIEVNQSTAPVLELIDEPEIGGSDSLTA